MGLPFKLMVTPPALPRRSNTDSLASTVRLWLGSSVAEKRYLPSPRARTQTVSSAVTWTRTAALGFGAGVFALGSAGKSAPACLAGSSARRDALDGEFSAGEDFSEAVGAGGRVWGTGVDWGGVAGGGDCGARAVSTGAAMGAGDCSCDDARVRCRCHHA